MGQWDRKVLEKLLIVQDLDIRIRIETDGIDELNLRNMREDPALNNMRADLGGLEESLEATRAQQEMYRNTLDDIRNAIKGLASTKSGAFKPRTRSSTEALRSEEEKLGILVDETEEQIQKLKQRHDTVEKEIAIRSKDVRTCQQVPEAEIKKHRGRVKKLEEQREVAVKGIPVALLRRYERLKKSRSGVGLTIMVDGVCRVCRMQMPTGVRFRLLKGEPISSCPACGRMVAKVENPTLAAEEAARAAAEEVVREKEKSFADAKARAEEKARKVRTDEKAAKPKAKKAASKKSGVVKPPVKKPASKKPTVKKSVAGKPAAAKKTPSREPTSKKKPAGSKK